MFWQKEAIHRFFIIHPIDIRGILWYDGGQMEEEEMLKNKYVIWFAGIFALFLGAKYWDGLVGLISLVLSAAHPLILGVVIAYMVNILMSFYQRFLFKRSDGRRFKKPVCMALAYVTLAGIVIFVIGLVLPELLKCIQQLAKNVPVLFDSIAEYLTNQEKIEPLMEELGITEQMINDKMPDIANMIATGLGEAAQSFALMLGSVVSMVITFVISVIFSVYMLIGKERLERQMQDLLTTYLPTFSEKIIYVGRVLNQSFHNFIVGQCTEAVILGGLCMVGMFIFQFPYALMIGTLIGFTALIPIAGAYIGAFVGALLIVTISPFKAFTFVIFLTILQQLEGNLIYPKVVGKSLGLPGMWVLAAVTIGGGVMGIGGMLIAVPVFAAIYKLVKNDVEKRKVKRELNS